HFVEVMTCPVGCVTGGGQPKLIDETFFERAYLQRISATYNHDKALPVRKSHENPSVKKLYEDYLKKPLGSLSHKLLHTTYCGDKKDSHAGH
ncbi:MAG: iron hydrogenase small subunit, partial [Deltaproteobacteria bacterium]|nr:iron hydrogenase small subunit [Deltaproteobacteria bacterium]